MPADADFGLRLKRYLDGKTEVGIGELIQDLLGAREPVYPVIAELDRMQERGEIACVEKEGGFFYSLPKKTRTNKKGG